MQVLECCSSDAGRIAGLLFALSGVGQVARVADSPAAPSGRSRKREAWLDRNKHLVPRSEDWPAKLSEYDIVLVDNSADLSLVRDQAPSAIVVHIDGIPAGTEAVIELLAAAQWGVMSLSGMPGRAPLFGIGHRIQHLTALYAFIGGLLRWIESGGRPTRMDDVTVSLPGAAVSFLDQFVSVASYSGEIAKRTGTSNSPSQPTAMYECLDGHVLVYTRLDGEWLRLARVAGAEDLLKHPDLLTADLRIKNAEVIHERLRHWMSRLTRRQVLDIALRERIPCAPVFSPGEALEFWDSEVHPEGWVRDYVAGNGEPRSNDPLTATVRRAPSTWRVVELGGGWAGPLAGRILAAAGADVVKVESDGRWDPWRGSARPDIALERYPDREPYPNPLDRCSYFNVENRGKKSVLIDAKSEQGRDQLRELVAEADIVISNLRPGSLESLGIGGSFREREHSGLATLAISAVGPAYPGMVAWGPTMEALAGMASRIGYADGPPLNTGFAIVDPLAGTWGLARLLVALVQNQSAVSIDVSLLESALAAYPEAIADSRWDARLENAHPDFSPHGAYRCAGDDAWLAIACQDDDQWAQLVRALGAAESAPRGLEALSERLIRRAEVDEWLTFSVAQWDRDELQERLLAHGVPCAAVREIDEVIADDELWRAGVFTSVEHPQAGERPYPELPIGEPGGARAPLLGEHDVSAVLAEWRKRKE